MVMNLIMKLGKIVAALMLAAAIIALATWGISLVFDLSDTLLGNFLGPLGLDSAANPSTVEEVDANDGFGGFDETGDVTGGFGGAAAAP